MKTEPNESLIHVEINRHLQEGFVGGFPDHPILPTFIITVQKWNTQLTVHAFCFPYLHNNCFVTYHNFVSLIAYHPILESVWVYIGEPNWWLAYSFITMDSRTLKAY